jgi:hypothetical protein
MRRLLGGIMIGQQRGDLLEEARRQLLVELGRVIALIEAQQSGVDMGALLSRSREGGGQRRDIAIAAGQGNENLADHLPLRRRQSMHAEINFNMENGELNGAPGQALLRFQRCHRRCAGSDAADGVSDER